MDVETAARDVGQGTGADVLPAWANLVMPDASEFGGDAFVTLEGAQTYTGRDELESVDTALEGVLAQTTGDLRSGHVPPPLVGSQLTRTVRVNADGRVDVVFQASPWVFPRIEPEAAYELLLNECMQVRSFVPFAPERPHALRANRSVVFSYWNAGIRVRPSVSSMYSPSQQLTCATADSGVVLSEVHACGGRSQTWDERVGLAASITAGATARSCPAYAGQYWTTDFRSQWGRPGFMSSVAPTSSSAVPVATAGEGLGAAADSDVPFDPQRDGFTALAGKLSFAGGAESLRGGAGAGAEMMATTVSRTVAQGSTPSLWKHKFGQQCDAERGAGASPRDALVTSRGLRAGTKILCGGNVLLLPCEDAARLASESHDPGWVVESAAEWPMFGSEMPSASVASLEYVPVVDARRSTLPRTAFSPLRPREHEGSGCRPATVGTLGLGLQAFVDDAPLGALPNCRFGNAYRASAVHTSERRLEGLALADGDPDNQSLMSWLLSHVVVHSESSAEPRMLVQVAVLYALATATREGITASLRSQIYVYHISTMPASLVANAMLARNAQYLVSFPAPSEALIRTLGYSFVETLCDVLPDEELTCARGPLRNRSMQDMVRIEPLCSPGVSPAINSTAARRFIPVGVVDPRDNAQLAYVPYWDAIVMHADIAPRFVAAVARDRRPGDALLRSAYVRLAHWVLENMSAHKYDKALPWDETQLNEVCKSVTGGRKPERPTQQRAGQSWKKMFYRKLDQTTVDAIDAYKKGRNVEVLQGAHSAIVKLLCTHIGPERVVTQRDIVAQHYVVSRFLKHVCGALWSASQ